MTKKNDARWRGGAEGWVLIKSEKEVMSAADSYRISMIHSLKGMTHFLKELTKKNKENQNLKSTNNSDL